MNFTLTVTSLTSSRTMTVQPLAVSGQHYTINAGDHPLCDLYRFQVLAFNPAGVSEPSMIDRRFPSLPNISQLERTLEHTLLKAANGVTLTVKFSVSNTSVNTWFGGIKPPPSK